MVRSIIARSPPPSRLPTMAAHLDGYLFHFLSRYIYAIPTPPPRIRDPAKPMAVLCIGMPRTGTESLQRALLRLGYDHTYHGWDVHFEQPGQLVRWVALCRRKWFGADLDGDSNLTAADFDEVLGHAVAVADAPASVFAAELIAAYPDAKVILNHRDGDMDGWHASVKSTIAHANRAWALWALSFLSRECWWAWVVYCRFMWPGLFRALDGNIETGIARAGRWVYREHYAMVRGMVPEERRLEWCVEDGWKPLCEFLGKEVPDEPFPHANAAAGWEGQERRVGIRYALGALEGLAVLGVVGAGIGAVVYRYLHN